WGHLSSTEQEHFEARSATHAIDHANVTAMAFDDPATKSEAKTNAAHPRRKKRLKNFGAEVVRHPGPIILDNDGEAVRMFLDRNLDPCDSPRRRLDGVRQQVRKELPKLSRIELELIVFGDGSVDADFAPPLHLADHALEDPKDTHLFGLGRDVSRKREDLADDAR